MIVDAKKLAKSPHDSKQLKELIQQRLANSTWGFKAGYYLHPLQFFAHVQLVGRKLP